MLFQREPLHPIIDSGEGERYRDMKKNLGVNLAFQEAYH